MTEKAHELAIELTDDSESISDVVNAKLVTKDSTIPNPFNFLLTGAVFRCPKLCLGRFILLFNKQEGI